MLKFSKAFVVALILADPALADQQSIDPEFAKKVEQVLIERPEIILKVFEILEAQQEAESNAANLDLVAALSDELFAGLDPSKPILVEFQDYNCGYCRRVHSNVAALKELQPDLQMVAMELPILGEGSRHAAEVALALKEIEGPAAYTRFSNALMGLETAADPVSVKQTLINLGFDADAILSAAADGAGREELQRSQQLARKIGATGTPYFIAPGGIIRGFGTVEELAAITMAPDAETATRDGQDG